MEALCEKLLQVTKDGVLHYTLDEGKILNVNQGLLKILDVDDTPESLQGKLINTAIFDSKINKKLNTHLLKKNEIHDLEYHFKTPKNEGKWLNLNTHIIDDSAFKGKTALAIVNDITKQKKLENEHGKLKRSLRSEKEGLLKVAKEIEEELKKSEQKYQNLVEKAGAGIATSDLKGRFTYVNNALCKMIGYSKEEIIGKSFANFLHPDDKKGILQIFWNAFKNPRKPIALEYRVIHKNGHIVHMHSIPTALIYNGKVLDFNAIITDITERKKAEEENNNLAKLPSEDPNPVLRIAKDGTIIYANDASKLLLNDWGRKVGQFIPAYWKKLVTNSLDAGEFRTKEVNVINRNFSFVLAPITEAGYVNLYGHDITARKKAEKALQKSEEQYKLIVENQTELINQVDLKGIIQFVSPAYCKFFGKTEEVVLGTSSYHLVYEEDREITAKEMENLLKPPHNCYVEQRVMSKDGWRWCGWASKAVLDDYNNVISIVSVGRDITERKNTEEKLRESEERFRQFFENEPEYCYLVSPEGKILDVNHSVLKTLGYKKEELVGKPLKIIYAPESLSKVKDIFEKWKNTNKLQNEELTIISKDGNRHNILLNLDVLKNRDGKIQYSISVQTDITERKRAEDALQESQKRYYSLFEYSPISLWEEDFSEVKKYIDKLKRRGVKNLKKYFNDHPEIINNCVSMVKVIDINKATLKLFKATNKENILSNLHNIFTEESYRAFKEELIAIAEGKDFLEFETTAKTLKDEIIYSCTRWAVVPGYEDIYSRVLITSIDITEQNRALTALEQSREQLRTLSAHLESVREEDRKTMAREIHDELGQSLTALKMDISWLNKRVSPDKPELINKTESMANLTNEIIQTVKKISSHLRPSIIDDLGLSAAIEWHLDDFQNRTGITCSEHSEPEDISMSTDTAITLFRIFQEALTNIARHAKASKARVSLKEEANKLILMIQDNGIGITEKQIQDPKSLGLLGIKERAYHIGGNVRISGKLGRGTMVRVSVPLKNRD